MSKQVAGKPEGATLLDAINDGDVEFPGRMTFMDWLKWRKSTGTRPLKKRDGVSTTLEEENVLWKEVRACQDVSLRARPEAQSHPARAVKASKDQAMPIRCTPGGDLAPHKDLGAGPGCLTLEEGHPKKQRLP